MFANIFDNLFDGLPAELVGILMEPAVAHIRELLPERNSDREAVSEAFGRACRRLARSDKQGRSLWKELGRLRKTVFPVGDGNFPVEIHEAILSQNEANAAQILGRHLRGFHGYSVSDDQVAHLTRHILYYWGWCLKQPRHEKGYKALVRDSIVRSSQTQPVEATTLQEIIVRLDDRARWRFAAESAMAPYFAELMQEFAFVKALTRTNESLARTAESQQETIRVTAEVVGKLVDKILPASMPQPWKIPAASAYFTGQEKFLTQLEKVLAQHEVGAITQPAGVQGYGGIGKTQLALAYAAKHKARYSGGGHFIVADSQSALDAGLARIADPQLPPDATQDLIGPLVDQAIELLQNAVECLLVLDNVDDIVEGDAFQEILRRLPKVHVLLTCRHNSMGEAAQVEVDEMDAATGALYVLRRGLGSKGGLWAWSDFSVSDQEAALALADDLDGFPLALDHAGFAIQQERVTPGEILADYRANRARILKNRGKDGTSHRDSVWVTTVLALEKLAKRNPAAAELVTCCAYLAPDAIFADLFLKEWVEAREPLASDLENLSSHRVDALRSGLVTAEPGRYWLWMHRVTQAVLQDWNPEDAGERFSELASKADHSLYKAGRYGQMLAHSEFACSAIELRFGSTSPETIDPMISLADSYRLVGRFSESIFLNNVVLERGSHMPTVDQRALLICANNLAVAYKEVGRYKEAREILEPNIDRMCNLVGPDDEGTLGAMISLASTYRALGLVEDSETIFKLVREIATKFHGEDNYLALVSINGLAEIYRKRGQLDDALKLQSECVTINKRTRGVTHPSTLTSMSNLASVYRDLGRHDEACSLQEQTLEFQKQSLGDEHPDTVRTMNNLAMSYRDVNRHIEAVKLLETVVSVTTRTLGHEHPDTNEYIKNLTKAQSGNQ